MDQVVNDKVTTESTPAGDEQSAFDKVFSHDQDEHVVDKENMVEKTEEQVVPTEETPPANNDQINDLIAKVDRIPELEKRLRDEGGRYGALKQSLEQLQQKITESTTRQSVADTTADAQELLSELRGEFPELAAPLEKAFSKLLSAKAGVGQTEIDKLVSERIAAQRDSERTTNLEEAKATILEFHPDFFEVKATPEFKAWKETLSPRLQAKLSVSEDPYFVAEQIDSFKEWQKSKADESATAQPSKRLADAVLPTKGNASVKRTTSNSEVDAFNAVFKKRNR